LNTTTLIHARLVLLICDHHLTQPYRPKKTRIQHNNQPACALIDLRAAFNKAVMAAKQPAANTTINPPTQTDAAQVSPCPSCAVMTGMTAGAANHQALLW
jgi:hypothetical protein